jgi:PhnB protein
MNRFQPEGWHTVTPRIITSEAEELVRFVKKVFRGQGEFQVNRPAEIRIGDSLLMISKGDGLREPVAAFLYVYVEDVDETYRRAVKAGAETLELPSDFPYGDRRAMVKDTWGNLWQIASRKQGNVDGT